MSSVLLAVLREARFEDESLLQAAERVMIEDALLEGGSGKEAARILGITERRFCYRRRKLGYGRGQENEFKPPKTAEEEPCSLQS